MLTEEKNTESLTSHDTVFQCGTALWKDAYIFYMQGRERTYPLPPLPPACLCLSITHTTYSLPTVIELLLYLLERNLIRMKTVLTNFALNRGNNALCLYLCTAKRPGSRSSIWYKIEGLLPRVGKAAVFSPLTPHSWLLKWREFGWGSLMGRATWREDGWWNVCVGRAGGADHEIKDLPL